MLCRIARWEISRFEDRAAKPPHWVERHAARCGRCRDYALFTASLKARLSAGERALLDRVPDFRLDTSAWDRAGDGADGRAPARRGLALRLLPAGAAAVAVLAAALVLFRVVPREPVPTPEDRAAARAALKSVYSVADGFPSAVMKAESTLERERAILAGSLASAAEYLQARLNVKVVRREPPKSG